MTRSDLINRLAELHPQLLAKDAELGVNVILDALTGTLSKGGRVEIRDFGSFDLKYRPPRTGRNPKTGEPLKIAAAKTVKFSAGKAFKDSVNKRKK